MKTGIILAALAAPTTLSAAPESNPEALTVAHTGVLQVAAPPELAFQLFTAPGEKLWVAEWDPTVLSGGDGRSEGAVFTTRHHDELTIWVVVDYQPETLHVRYARVAPASRAGTVEVNLRPDGEGGSLVEVSYHLTAVSEAGAHDLTGFDASGYADMLAEWEQAIETAVADGRIDWTQLGEG